MKNRDRDLEVCKVCGNFIDENAEQEICDKCWDYYIKNIGSDK